MRFLLFLLKAMLTGMLAHPATPTPAAPPPSQTETALVQRIEHITHAIDGKVGVAALDLETGRRIAVRGDERFPMGSVFKFPVAISVLQQVDAGRLSLDERVTLTERDYHPGYSAIRDDAHGKPTTFTIRELLDRMLGASDNSAADYLLRRVGGPDAVTKTLRNLGIRDIRVDRSEALMAADIDGIDQLPPETQWSPRMFEELAAKQTKAQKAAGVTRYNVDYRDTATPRGMAALLQKAQEGKVGLSHTSNELLLSIMTASTTGPHRVKGELPSGTKVAHKTGTMPLVANDAAIITSPDGRRHLIVVIFTKQSTAKDEARDKVRATIARTLYDEMLAGRVDVN